MVTDRGGAHFKKRALSINHLFFADDSLLFCKADLKYWNRISKILSTYERASGQRLNREKTAIFFSRNTEPQVKRSILEVAGIPGFATF
jgi:hypothetical protein